MKFHCILSVKNEGDIIRELLDHLLTWADGVYILDTGSTDETWDIVQDFATQDSRIVPFMRKSILFNNPIRGWLFNAFRDRMSDGDWVVRTDADEFYDVESPRQFVANRLAPHETRVELQWYYFRLTQDEVDDWEGGRETMDDRKRSIRERRRFFMISEASEWRMFRYRRSIRWPSYRSQPWNAGYVAQARIPISHYPHRDPEQMKSRIALRQLMKQYIPGYSGQHWSQEDWRQEVVKVVRDGQGSFMAQLQPNELSCSVNAADLRIYENIPGTPLPPLTSTNHLEPKKTRFLKRVLHSTCVGLIDQFCEGFNDDFQPQSIPELG